MTGDWKELVGQYDDWAVVDDLCGPRCPIACPRHEGELLTGTCVSVEEAEGGWHVLLVESTVTGRLYEVYVPPELGPEDPWPVEEITVYPIKKTKSKRR